MALKDMCHIMWCRKITLRLDLDKVSGTKQNWSTFLCTNKMTKENQGNIVDGNRISSQSWKTSNREAKQE